MNSLIAGTIILTVAVLLLKIDRQRSPVKLRLKQKNRVNMAYLRRK